MELTDWLWSGLPHCKRCRVELDGGERVCPSCNYAPRQEGLRWAGYGILVVMLSMVSAQLSVLVIPWIGPLFLVLAVFGFLFAFASFFLAMVATPYRFGALFDLL